MVKSILKYTLVFLLPLLQVCLVACNTGIETTKAIKMSRAERKEVRPGNEELLADSIVSQPLSAWKPGKPFMVADDKVALVLESGNDSYGAVRHSLKNHVFRFDGTESRSDAGGETVTLIRFRDGDNIYKYNTGRNADNARHYITGLDIPMMIDLDMVALADSLLKGRRIWIMNQLWYDGSGNKLNGRKYVPVNITGVRAGDIVFPCIVDFTDEHGASASVFMNIKAASGIGAESRTLPALFSLVDPKDAYPSILPDNWKLIQSGNVALGMTKDECRLALGTPSDVDAGHNWSSTIDVWSYKDGMFLQFEDGLLVNFRR